MFGVESLFPLLNYRLFRNAARITGKLFNPKQDVIVKVGKHQMYANSLDRIAALYLWKFSYLKSFEHELVKKTIKNRMIVLDIGANIGFHTLQFADLVGTEGKVFAFEPDPENFSLLIKNLEKNDYQNVIPIQKAVTDKTGKIDLYLSEENKGDHRVFDSEKGRKTVEIETVTLDDFLAIDEHVDFIKLDIQGSEHLAFLGMKNTINRNDNLKIICEFSPYLLKRCFSSADIFLNLILKSGFKLQILNEKKRCLEFTTPENLTTKYDSSKLYDYVNLYLEKN